LAARGPEAGEAGGRSNRFAHTTSDGVELEESAGSAARHGARARDYQRWAQTAQERAVKDEKNSGHWRGAGRGDESSGRARGTVTHLKFSHSRRDIMPRRTVTAPAPAGRKGAMRARADLQRALPLSSTPLVARPRRVPGCRCSTRTPPTGGNAKRAAARARARPLESPSWRQRRGAGSCGVGERNLKNGVSRAMVSKPKLS